MPAKKRATQGTAAAVGGGTDANKFNANRRITKRQSNLDKTSPSTVGKQKGKFTKRNLTTSHQQQQQQQQLDEEIEKFVLPPLSPTSKIELMSNTSRTGSSIQGAGKEKGQLSDPRNSYDEEQGGDPRNLYEGQLGNARNQRGGEKSPTGVLSQGVLTRRNISAGEFQSRHAYHPRDVGRAIRGDSRLSNYERGMVPGERVYNSRYGVYSGEPFGNHRVLKERPTDKVVTFYRSFNSTQAELKFRVSRLNHRTLGDVMADLSRRIILSERERFIHTSHGTILNDVMEFEDGGSYFFGPPHVYDMSFYHNFRTSNTPPNRGSSKVGSDTRDSSLLAAGIARRGSRLSSLSYDNRLSSLSYDNRLSSLSYDNRSDQGSTVNQLKPFQSLNRRKRLIKVIANNDPSHVISFLVDEGKHRSVYEIIGDVTDQLRHVHVGLRNVRIDRICTHGGKILQKVDEFFQGMDDFYAHAANFYPPAASDVYDHSDIYQRKSIMAGGRILENGFPYTASKPVKVNILNNSHILEPPMNEYNDPAFRRARDYQPELQLEWIYGYNGTNCRNNIYVLPSNEVLYFVSKVVVIYNEQTQQQRFYTEHTDAICSIAQHPNSWVFATGQVSGGFDPAELSHVRLWDSKILVTLNTLDLTDVNLRVEHLDFSEIDNGVRLATLATQNDEWYLAVWDWEDSIKLSCSDAYFDQEFDMVFDPNIKDQLITCGKDHMFFWDVSRADAVYEIGQFKNCPTPDVVTCVEFDDEGTLISADSNGFIHIWEKSMKKTLSIIKTIHSGAVISMRLLPDNYMVTSTNTDCRLSLISYNDMVPAQSEIEIDEQHGGIVAIAPMFSGFRGSADDFDYLKLVIGTSSNDVLFGSFREGFSCLVKGASAELTAVVIHPRDNLFVTAGEDCNITLWSSSSHSEVWEVTSDQPCSAVDFNPNGDVIAVGTKSGRWNVYNRLDGSVFASFQCDRSSISCISYSPDGDMIAIGTNSGFIFFYECSNDGLSYRFNSRCQNSVDAITAIDWALNVTAVRFMNSNFDLFHWDVAGKRLEDNRHAFGDVLFETERVPITFQTSGLWIENDKELLWKAAGRSNSSTMYIAGATTGMMRVYNYPCDLPTMDYLSKIENNTELYHEVNVHTSEVANVGFFATDVGAISNGVSDFCVAQWRVNRKIPPSMEDRRFQHRYPGAVLETRASLMDVSASQSKFTMSQRVIRNKDSVGNLTAPRMTKRRSLAASHEFKK